MKWITPIVAAGLLLAADLRPVGTLQSVDISQMKLMLKTDGGPDLVVLLDETTRVIKVKPGERDLNNATPLQLSDLAVGDRVLVRGNLSEDQKTIPARQIVVMTKGELASKQSAERAAWDRGVSGTVKGVDVGAKKIDVEVRSGMPGAPPKPMTIQLSEKAVIRRYAPDSVKFSDAQPATIAEIKVGDQVRARGEKSADETSLAADELVAGTFRNIAATIVAVDSAANTIKVNDLDAKKPLTVKLSSDSNLRRMPEMMARMLSMRLNAGEGAAPAGGPSAGGPPMGMRPGMGAGPGGPGGSPPNPGQMLERMPAIQIAELKAGDALIIASTAGKNPNEVTAITLLAGVEPILTAPSRNRQMMLGNWNIDMNMGMGTQ